MSKILKDGDSWDAHMDLCELWAEAGGTDNLRFSAPFKRQADAMEKRLRAAGVPHPMETMIYDAPGGDELDAIERAAAELQDGVGEGQPG